ncbi:MAG TPA: hypothetical protein VFF13_02435 [archaeon]|nr:hypothetical protein [archaeon]
MSKFTNTQKKIAVLLLNSPKTVDELNKQLNIPYDELNENLRQMLKLKLLKFEGYPQKYKLTENIVEAVRRRKEIQDKDPFELRLKAIIEFKAVEESFLDKHMSEIQEKINSEKDFTIYDVFKAEPEQDGTQFTSYLELNLSAKDFTSLIRFMYFYGPTSIEVIKPKKVVLAMDDLQDALMEMAEMIQVYNHAMLKSMNKQELDDFAKSLYAPKK